MSMLIKPKICVVGIGGCGCNTINRLYEIGVDEDVKIVAMHTEMVHLNKVKIKNKVLIGETITQGHGSGGNPSVGELVMREDMGKVLTLIDSPDVLIVTGGLGGGTASGGIPVLLEEVRNKMPNTLRIALVTIPFSFEGVNRFENAKIGLRGVLENADLTIISMNDLLLKRIGNIRIQYAFKFMDLILVNTIKGLIDLMTKGGVVSISYADLVSIVKNAGLGVAGHGIGRSVAEACESSIRNLLLDATIDENSNVLLYIRAPERVTLEEASKATSLLTEKYKVERIFWGLTIDKALNDYQVMLIASNIYSPTIEELVGTIDFF